MARVNQVILIFCCLSISTMYSWHDCRLSAAACPLVGGGGWGHGWWIQRQFNISKKVTNNQTDGTRKKRIRTEVSDSSTSDEESMTKCQNISTDNWPRFLFIEPISEGALNYLSPFAIHKALQGLAGELKCVKRIKNGRLSNVLNNTIQSTFWNLKLCAMYLLRLVHTRRLIHQRAS